MRGDRERCLAAGMDDYVAKPIQSAELAQALAGIRPTAVSPPPPARPASPGPGAAAFDHAAALVRVQGDEELLAEIIHLFLQDYVSQLTAIRTAVETANDPALHQTAHQAALASLREALDELALAMRAAIEPTQAAPDSAAVALRS